MKMLGKFGGRRSTTFRVSLGVVSLSIGLLLAAELLGLLPDRTELKLAARQKSIEMVAVQIASAAARNDVRMVQTIVTTVVERDDEVLSAAVRRRGNLLAVAGPHEEFWEPLEDGRSTPTHVQVPIMKDAYQWGQVELRFRSLQSLPSLADWKDSPFAIFAFFGLAGFALYFLFLRRALRELDPSSVVPEHVRSAFNALAEGVIIIDEDERIVLANQEFANMMERSVDDLIGLKASELGWNTSAIDGSVQQPWQDAMKEGKSQTGISLSRSTRDKTRIFSVNGAPILDAKGKTRGALATFDDVSEIEKKNQQLEDAMRHLSQSREAIKLKNKELEYLATHDPLTSLLNRRALFEQYEEMFEKASKDGTLLSGLMVDIDHFKSVNDRFGHSVGDEVIEFVAKKLISTAKPEDLSARYGGEEFCMILPGTSLTGAAALGERLRLSIIDEFSKQFSYEINLTVSVGAASLLGAQDSTMDLLNRADKALYAAKSNGRNRVVKWGDPELDAAEKNEQQTHLDDAQLVRKTMSAG